MKSLLRWAGGKQRLVSRLLEHVPAAFDAYHEPFLGAGSMFAALEPETARLSDLNVHLVGLYEALQDNAERVAHHTTKHVTRDSAEYYYYVRDEYNRIGRLSASTQAARFLYLNRTCFNGIFRVNKTGEFNVPYGHLARPIFPTQEELNSWGQKLHIAEIAVRDFRDACESAVHGDFVYLDPPYPPLNGTSFFRHYTSERFSKADQEDVARMARMLDHNGVMFMVTNADLPRIRELYDGFRVVSLDVTRNVSCKRKKKTVAEVVISNY